jgi:phenylalanyl-tRNA synthetase alpha subunit
MDSVYNEILTDSDLCNETYSLDVLKKNINNLNKKVVLSTQHLTAQFCVKFILDTAIESGNQESGVYTKDHILRLQKHISSQEIDKYYLEYVIKGNSNNTI